MLVRIIFLFGLALSFALADPALAADWPQFLGPNRTGVTTDGRLARSWPAGGPKELWNLKMGPGFSVPAVEQGKLYVLDYVKPNEILRCLDFATGEEAWNVSYESAGEVPYPGPRCTPAVDDKYIFTVGWKGHFQCVDKATRKQLWTHDLLAEYELKLPPWGVTQSPLLYHDLVIVAPQAAKAGVAAFEKSSGKLVWKSEHIGSLETAYASPALADIGGMEQIVMLSQQDGSARCNVVGIDPADGKILWSYNKFKCNIYVTNPVNCGEGRFLVTGGYGSNSALFKVEKQGDKYAVTELYNANPAAKKGAAAATAEEKPLPLPGSQCSSQLHTPLFYRDHIYANGNSRQNASLGLTCLGLDGMAKWSTAKTVPVELGDLIIVDDLLVSLAGNGVLRLAEATPAGYKQLAEAKVSQQHDVVWAGLAFADGKLMVRDDSALKCLDLRAAK